MCPSRIFVFSLCIVLFSSIRVESQGLPGTIACTSNAKASRDYYYAGRRWEGEEANPLLGVARSSTFKIHTRDSKVENAFYSLRDKVFVDLDTDRPLVYSTTRYTDGDLKEEKFRSTVVMRTDDVVFISWTNKFNKLWLSAVDLKHRKATLTQVFQGATSVGGEVETLDCH